MSSFLVKEGEKGRAVIVTALDGQGLDVGCVEVEVVKTAGMRVADTCYFRTVRTTEQDQLIVQISRIDSDKLNLPEGITLRNGVTCAFKSLCVLFEIDKQ